MRKRKLNNNHGFTLVELIVVLTIMAILIGLLVPALTGYIDKAKQAQAKADARQVMLASQTCIIEWHLHSPIAAPNTVEYRKEQQVFMQDFMGSECGMGREDYDCYRDNTFTTLTTTNNVNWSNITNKSRGVNRAMIFLSKDRSEVVGIFYINKEGTYAVRNIITPWTPPNKAPEVATAGIFVEKIK